MTGKRIFIALDISDAARSVCSRHIDGLREEFPHVRVGWERPEKLHMTLEFLGQVDAHVLGKLKDRLSETASGLAPFNLTLSNTGVFPSRSRARIFWIGINDAQGAADNLYVGVRDVCSSLGYKGDVKPFRPHVTIGRVREIQGAAQLVSRHLDAKIEPVSFEVSEIVIYESQLRPTGSVYSVVSKARLLG